MFYSHEVLTSRKYGVATVWLVATLGAKSQSKKVNRKAISEVDVGRACKSIIDPAAPMALRLQGNLLYGVSRVYLQQCGYVLQDAQNAYSDMHLVLRAVRNSMLDPEAGKARPEQLILEDDPSFLPGFTLPPLELLAELNLGPPLEPLSHAGDSQSLTPFGSQRVGSEQVPTTPRNAIGGIILPASSTVPSGGFGISGNFGASSLGGGVGTGGFDDDMPEPDFTFDANGNWVDLSYANAITDTPAAPKDVAMSSHAGASAQVRQEHEKGLQAGAGQIAHEMVDDLTFGEDLLEGDAFPIGPQHQPSSSLNILASSDSAIIAPVLRKKREARIIPVDKKQEVPSSEVAAWERNYVENMKKACEKKKALSLSQQAKKNAEYYVWGVGIGAIMSRLQGATVPTPFDMFKGDNLFELFTGINRNGHLGKKRDRDSGIDDVTQEEARRVRQRTEDPEDQIGRGAEDEVMFDPGEEDVELPREAPSALDDQQLFSVMPWNMSASVRGSSVVPHSSRIGRPIARSDTRMISASPLNGRGGPGDVHGSGDRGLEQFEEDDSIYNNYGGFAGFSSEMPQPEAGVAESTIRVRDVLSAEGENFIAFVAAAIDEKRVRAQAAMNPLTAVGDATANTNEVLFEELIPYSRGGKMVAAQALIMALTLATKGMLDVRQDEDFEDIGLSLTEQAKVSLAEEVSRKENEGGEDVDMQELIG